MVHQVLQFLAPVALHLMVLPDKAQYVLVCNTEDCEKIVRRVVNFTAMTLTNKRVNIPKLTPDESRYHKVAPYNQQKKLSVEKCKLHPTRNIEIHFKNSNLPALL